MGKRQSFLRKRFAGMRLHQKFRVLEAVTLGLVLMMSFVLVLSVLGAEQKKEEALERTVLSATEHYTERLLESTVSVARSVYINEDLYTFLNTRYDGSTDYFAAFHEIQRNSPLILADNNEVISGCTVYTTNPSIMSGSRIQSLRTAEDEDWYRLFVRLGKNTILHCDPENGTLSLIRKLDYTPTRFNSILKLDISLAPLHTYCQSLSFDGELYILSGGTALYSSEGGTQMPDIETDFAASAANYYTADIEYYANAAHKPPLQFLREHWLLPVILLLALAVLGIVGGSLASDTQRRAAQAIVAASREGGLEGLTEQDYGKDEIGDLVRTSIAYSGRLELASDRLLHTRDALTAEKNHARDLLGQALFLDACVQTKRDPAPMRTLAEELRDLPEGVTIPTHIPEGTLPSLILVHPALQLLQEGAKVTVSLEEHAVVLHAARREPPPQRWALFINAIFEDGEPDAAFTPGDPRGPYLRLRLCGARASARNDGTLIVRLPLQ